MCKAVKPSRETYSVGRRHLLAAGVPAGTILVIVSLEH